MEGSSSLETKQSLHAREFLLSCKLGRFHCIEEFKGNCNVQRVEDAEGRSGLHWASKGDHLDVVKVLCHRFRLDPRQRDQRGKNSLHLAAEFGALGVVEFFMHGPLGTSKYINNCDLEGNTALALACKRSNSRIVQTLLRHGADPSLKSKAPNALLQTKDPAVARKLLDTGMCDPTLLHPIENKSLAELAAEDGNAELLEVILPFIQRKGLHFLRQTVVNASQRATQKEIFSVLRGASFDIYSHADFLSVSGHVVSKRTSSD